MISFGLIVAPSLPIIGTEPVPVWVVIAAIGVVIGLTVWALRGRNG